MNVEDFNEGVTMVDINLIIPEIKAVKTEGITTFYHVAQEIIRKVYEKFTVDNSDNTLDPTSSLIAADLFEGVKSPEDVRKEWSDNKDKFEKVYRAWKIANCPIIVERLEPEKGKG